MLDRVVGSESANMREFRESWHGTTIGLEVLVEPGAGGHCG